MKKLFENQIRVYRALHKMSQEDLAKMVAVRRETIGNIENGRYNPSLLLAMEIASIFNVPVDDLFQRIKSENEHG
jgi:putative transcriptional regulator